MKDKLINILFFFSLTLLLVSLFSQKPQQVVQSDPYMTVSSKDLVVPNFPKIYLHNPAQKDISFDVCKDFAIYQNFATAPVPLPKNFCKLLTIPASGSGTLSLHELHQIFEYPSTTVFKAQF
jgi:hypothetical protein